MTDSTAPATTVTSTPSLDSTILTPTPSTTTPGTPTPQGGTPNADPNAGKPADGSTPDPSAATPPATPAGAPEKYADFKLPESLPLDATAIEEFKTLAKESGLTQDAAQKIVDFQVRLTQKADADFKSMQEGWKQESLKALGQNSAVELGYAAKFRDQFADKETLDLLKETGLGNHPAVVKMFVKAGKAIAEDRFVDGKSSAPNAGSTEARLNRLFPSSAKR